MSSQFAGICHRCPHVQPPPYSGKCACTIDGRDILDHAKDRYCPLGRFRLGLGDWIARVLTATGLRPLLARMALDIALCNAPWLADGQQPTCGCAERQTALNG
jgi:hypothetical protein